MADHDQEHPSCYGKLNTVFPLGKNGLRQSPESCMVCFYKTDCLRTALKGPGGIVARKEMTDRAYTGGSIGFFERWSRKKALERRSKQAENNKNTIDES